MDKQSDEDIELSSHQINRNHLSRSVESTSEKTRNGKSETNDYSRVYERDSMERFGDDLTEQVIQYLLLRDKVLFEFVCKQWQRLVFNKQTELHINYWDDSEQKNSLHHLFVYKSYDNLLDRRILESVLKKCPNISRVNMYHNRDNDIILDQISKYCRRVTKLVVPASCGESSLMSFATKHGIWLEEFSCQSLSELTSDLLKKILQKCPNIAKIDVYFVHDNIPIIESDLAKKLKVIKKIWIRANESDVLKALVRKYEKTLKGLDIRLSVVSLDELKTCFAHISRFESLESLRIEILFGTTIESIEEYLQMLAKKCTKLKILKFHSAYSGTSQRLFFAFSEFRSLERLDISLVFETHSLEGSVEYLKNCNRLKHLSITYIGFWNLDFLVNIQTFLPNLRYLEFQNYRIFVGNLKPFIESLQSMKYIERVVVNNSMKFYYQKNRLESKPRNLCKMVVDIEEYLIHKN